MLELDAKGVLNDVSKVSKATTSKLASGSTKIDKIVSIGAGMSQTIVSTKNGNVIVWGDGLSRPAVIKSASTSRDGVLTSDPLTSVQGAQTFKRYISMSVGRSGGVLISKDINQAKKITNQVQAITGTRNNTIPCIWVFLDSKQDFC